MIGEVSLLRRLRDEGWTPGTELPVPQTVDSERQAASDRDSSAAAHTEVE